jgi:hypothetical protein
MSPKMTSDDICAIIRQCGESGVSELTFGSLSIRFASENKRGDLSSPEIAHHGISHSTTDYIFDDSFKKSDEEDKRILEEEEIRMREDQLSMALIEDPAQFEKLLAAGDLENEE